MIEIGKKLFYYHFRLCYLLDIESSWIKMNLIRIRHLDNNDIFAITIDDFFRNAKICGFIK